MKKKHIKRLYLIAILFLIVSFVSVTYAWFTYSGISSGFNTEVDVRAWYIEFSDNDEVVTNDLVISTSEIYPGMDTVYETIKITNKGDSEAMLSVDFREARILDVDTYQRNDTLTSEEIQDILAHNYPFKINVNLKDNYVTTQGGVSEFEVSISWPADQGDNELDTYWGEEAYDFNIEEVNKYNLDNTYQIREPIELLLTVKAEQLLDSSENYDVNYNLGDTVLFDVVSNTGCTSVSATCLVTKVIDTNNKIKDDTVTLLPDIRGNFSSVTGNNYLSTYSTITAGWSVTSRPLVADDIFKIISKDIQYTNIKIPGYSDIVLGNLSYGSRLTSMVTNISSKNASVNFLNSAFPYLETANCVWTNTSYNANQMYSLQEINTELSNVYGNDNINTCKVVPVIVANKVNLSTN